MKILKKWNIECPYRFKNTEQNKGTENNKNILQYNKKNNLNVILFEYL